MIGSIKVADLIEIDMHYVSGLWLTFMYQCQIIQYNVLGLCLTIMVYLQVLNWYI